MKLKDLIYVYNIKTSLYSIGFVTILIAVLYFIFFLHPDLRQSNGFVPAQFGGTTTGIIIEIKPKSEMSQSKWKGTNIKIVSYEVWFAYSIKEIPYFNSETLYVTGKNYKLIERLLKKQPNDTIKIIYKLDDHSQGILKP